MEGVYGENQLGFSCWHGKPTHRKVNCYAFPYFPVFTKHKQISCISYSIFLCAYACSHVHPWARGQYQCLPLLLSTFISEAKIDYIGSWGNSCLWLPPPKAQHCGYTWTKATISRNSMGRGDLHIWTHILHGNILPTQSLSTMLDSNGEGTVLF